MLASISHRDKTFIIDFLKPIDISIPLRAGANNVNAWYAPPVKIEPVVMSNWIGDVKQGGSVNFRNVWLNPHAHGTHTECVGHISKEDFSLNTCLTKFFFGAQLITVKPEAIGEDLVISKEQIQSKLNGNMEEAIIIRTMPNGIDKCTKQYSNSNPPFIHTNAINFFVEKNVKHLLIDLPSVDKERDDGVLAAHHAFWRYPEQTRTDATITELFFADDSIEDGFYFLNLQITSLENDASPSKPVLYKPLS